MKSTCAKLAVSIGLALVATPCIAQDSPAKLYGPSEYLSIWDSPFYKNVGYFEDFEDSEMNAFGASFNAGFVLGPGFNTDSVDADDGEIDGLGLDGHSWFVLGSAGHCQVTFDEEALGGLPTWAGIVWTDGHNEVLFEAFDANGESLGALTNNSADGDAFGGTAEDRFFGLVSLVGIKSLNLTCGAGLPMEVDHLQYGDIIPAPSTLALAGVVGLMASRRRRT
jgi:hypothetical protein